MLRSNVWTWASRVLVIGLALWSVIRIAGAIQGATETPDAPGETLNLSSVDFHSFWYYNQLLREGRDPYQGYLGSAAPQFPIEHLDGVTASPDDLLRPMGSFDLMTAYPYTAPFVLLISPLSFFTWPVARAIWLATNLGMMLVIPWLACRFVQNETQRIPFKAALLLALVFYGFLPVKVVLGYGQTTLLILALMLMALLLAREDRDVLAGIVLGVALSKYSLAIGVLVFFLFQMKIRLLVTAAITQIAALVGLAMLASTSPLDIVRDYLDTGSKVGQQAGIHLENYLHFLPQAAAIGIALVCTVAVVAAAFARFRRVPGSPGEALAASTLITWSLIPAYHNYYDAAVLIIPLAFVVLVLYHSGRWRLSGAEAAALAALGLVALGLLVFPGTSLVERLIPSMTETWGHVQERWGVTIVVLALTGVQLWLLARLRYAQAAEQPAHTAEVRVRRTVPA
jgi:hypothetical protein